MLALLTAFLISLSGARAQGFTQVSYNFPSVPDHATDGAVSCSTSLTMNSLAANGTGQWTSYNPGTGPGNWALLGNHLEDPASDCSYHGGIVQTGSLNTPMGGTPDEIKVTANLEGCVRYVTPDPSRNNFIVQGFDEQGFNPTNYQIDFSFESGSNGMTLSNTQSTIPVTKSMVLYNIAVPTLWNGIMHPVTGTENPRDEMDIASDQDFLYIIWEATDGDIYVTVVQLSDGTVVPGFPQWLGQGMRPTIAVDIRNEPSLLTVSFDAAWIHPAFTAINYRRMVNGTLDPNTYTLTTLMEHPTLPDDNYGFAYHARVLVGSALGADPSSNGPRAIYAIVDKIFAPGTTGHLILFKDVQRYTPGWVPEHAYYVDGMWSTTAHPVPIDGVFPVDDDPIIAFANPYDGQGQVPPGTPGTTPSNEYHCLYRLQRTYNGGMHNPLMIVRSADGVWTGSPMNQCLNLPIAGFSSINRPDAQHAFSEDPAMNISYIGAANQMGIHCHWRSGTNVHYYMRDARSLDEEIEEYTLETNATTVSDGTSHQSTATNFPTRIQDGRYGTVVLWGEPTSTEFARVPGGYHDPVLNFSGVNAELRLGVPTSDEGIFGVLVGFPTFKVNFTDATQSLVIDNSAIFDYYGNSISGSLEHFSFSGSGSGVPSVLLQGNASESGMSAPENGFPTWLAGRAVLNIHGGCGFTTTTAINFSANFSDIDCLHEIGPAETGTTMSDGFDYCTGPQEISECILQGGTAGAASGNPEVIQGRPCSLSNGSSQFALTNSLIENLGTSGNLLVNFKNNPQSTGTQYHAVTITGGKFDGSQLRFEDPTDFITVTFVVFDDIDPNIWYHNDPTEFASGYMLEMVRPNLPNFNSYQLISVTNCEFHAFLADQENGAPLWHCLKFGLFDGVTGYIMENIHAEDNEFKWSGSGETGSDPGMWAAIDFDDSYGLIANNDADQAKYRYGIFQISGTNDMVGNSLICSNTLENMKWGIATDYYNGYAKKNTVTACQWDDHACGDYDDGHIIFSKYTNSVGAGLNVTPLAHPDLTGVHHTNGDGDVAAFNVITGNGTNGDGHQIHLSDDELTGSTGLIDLGKMNSAWSVWGENDIEGTEDVYGEYGTSTNIGDVSNNYWNAAGFATNVGFSNDVQCSKPTAPTVFCSDGAMRSRKNPKTSAVGDVNSIVQDSSSCASEFQNGKEYVDEGAPQVGRDTLENFVEQCYDQVYSWQAFNYLNASVSEDQSTNDTKWLNLRNWLFSVLYLNSDTLYYCSDVAALTATFAYYSGSRGLDRKGQIAVEKYIVESGKCPLLDSNFVHGISAQWGAMYTLWKDTVRDSIASPFDSTLPTLQQIGFEILLGPQYGAVHNGMIPTSVLGAIGISPNPFVDRTEISYTLNVPATLTVEVYDVLGKKISAPVPSVFTQNGDYTLVLGNQIPPGTYYVRFAVPEGEVQTVKLVKE